MSAPAPEPRRRRWGRRLAVLTVAIAVLYLARTPILRAAASVLVADDGLIPCTRVAVMNGDRRYDAAARLVAADQAGGVLLVQTAPTRTQTLGLRPPTDERERRELARRGLAADRVEVIPGRARTGWDWARQLGDWMSRHPDATVLVLVDRFDSRHARLVFRQALPPETFARVRFAALPQWEYTEADWWRAKSGGLAFGFGMLDLAYSWLGGEGPPPPEPATPEALEAAP